MSPPMLQSVMPTEETRKRENQNAVLPSPTDSSAWPGILTGGVEAAPVAKRSPLLNCRQHARGRRACSLDDSAQAYAVEAATAKLQNRKAACLVRLDEDESPIRGITSIDNVAILNIEGTGTSAVPDLAGRLFTSLAAAGVSVVMVAQASADASVCVVVEEAVGEKAIEVVKGAFENELRRGLVAGVNLETGQSVVAIVGEGMAFRPGTGATCR